MQLENNINNIQSIEKRNEMTDLNIDKNKKESEQENNYIYIKEEGSKTTNESDSENNSKNKIIIEKENKTKIELDDKYLKDKDNTIIKKNEEDKSKNGKEKLKKRNKIKKHNRPVYKIPPSKKRSISQGKSLVFIHKYYDENFILEEDSEENSSDNEIQITNKDIVSKNITKKIFKEVKVTKITKLTDNKNK